MTPQASIQALLAPAIDGADQRRASRWSRRVAMDVVAAIDTTLVAASVVFPIAVFETHGISIASQTTHIQVAIFTAGLTFLLLQAWGCYAQRQLHQLPRNGGIFGAALVTAMVATMGVCAPFPLASSANWTWYCLWFSGAMLSVLAWRTAASRVLNHAARAGRFDQRICVYGAGPIARRVETYLANRECGLRFVGTYDDRAHSGRDGIGPGQVEGTLDDLIAAGRRGEVDQILIALPQSADRRIAAIARRLEQLPVSLHVVTHMASDLVDPIATHKVSALGPIGMLDVKPNLQADWAPVIKRAEDLILGTLFLAVSAPLMALIAIAIKLDSPGPVLFRQRRRGLNGQVFDVLKFRTMTVLEDGDSVRQASPDDERVTAIGTLLRRTSLDELPQLANVLNGEMSLVGPRPHALAHDDAWRAMLNRYTSRMQVKPGITGLAQVQGARGLVNETADLHRRLESDLEYISNWSLFLDIKILALTLVTLPFAKNAH